MSDTSPTALDPNAARLRSGTAARLAGLPVTTLRVWERRYGVVAAPKTTTGQRLYSSHDVQRLRLLKQLTERGHAIGTIAALPLDALQSLAAGEPPDAAAARQVRVIGHGGLLRLQSVGGCTPQAAYDDLDAAEAAADAAPPPDLLLAHLPSLQPGMANRLLALASRWQVRATIVLYAFGAEAVVEQLRSAGVHVRREPLSGRELARLLAATRPLRPVWTATALAAPAADTPSSPRRFSDEALLTLAEQPSPVACECPRHVAEIVLQLAGFERYSADCLSRNEADAALHRHLSRVAGIARSLFEQALERVMVAEGIEMPVAAAAP